MGSRIMASRSGGWGKVALDHQVADRSEDGHDKQVEGGVVDRIAADHAQGDDDGHEHGAGDGNDLARAAYCNEPAHQHHNIGDDEGGEDAVYGNGMFHEQERAGGEPLNHERAEHDGGNDVSGHPEGQERDQRAAAYRVVGGIPLRRCPPHSPCRTFPASWKSVWPPNRRWKVPH